MKKAFKMMATIFSAIALIEMNTASIFFLYQPEQPKK